jgi:PAS domain S-box-containing protein/putative nucleotidyltransferase with HDIG domain
MDMERKEKAKAEGAMMKGTRILVVEDETIVRMDIRYRLERLGYDVIAETERGEDAVGLVDSLHPDIVLMDIMLAGEMDGIRAATVIGQRQDIPVVYLTAYADDETLQRAKATQPSGYIIKPFEDREVYTAIEMAMYRHKVERQRREERKWREATLDSVGEGIVAMDSSGRITAANAAALGLAGRNGDDLMGVRMEAVFPFVDDEGRSVCDLVRSQSCSETFRTDRMYLVAGEARVPVELSCSPVVDDRGVGMGQVLAFRDITMRRERTQELQRNVERLRLAVEATVQALVSASEKRDPYTAGHQQRVSALAVAMARRMGLDDERVEGLRMAGLVHDLGKIQIPAEILVKPSRLTEMEFGLMRTHSEAGWDILRHVPFPWAVADFVHQHHERLDGSGYPQGLSGDAILPEARILAVADVVEAMSSHRPYRAALGVERALEEIRAGRGTVYDADAVDACLALFEESGFSFEA